MLESSKNSFKNPIKMDNVSRAIWLTGTILGSTWRYSIDKNCDQSIVDNPGKGILFALWHSNLLPLAYIYRNKSMAVMVSASKDGIRASAVAQKWNFEIIQGSSSKHGFSAFRQCLRTLQGDKNIAITTDGPRGPREVVKSGIAHLCVLTKAPVIPISVHPSSYWRLKSWDRMIIPKPFSRLLVKTGEHIRAEQTDNSNLSIEMIRKKIEGNLHAITMA